MKERFVPVSSIRYDSKYVQVQHVMSKLCMHAAKDDGVSMSFVQVNPTFLDMSF